VGNNRGMNVAVCVKQIPDPAVPGKLDPGTKTLVREGKLIMDDSDAYGVEMALQLLEQAGGGEVTLISMAPNGEVSGLRTALAMGAHKAILVSDDALKGSDALTTAKVLAAAIKRVNPDLLVAATESTDGYTGTTPVQVAELLGLPSITAAKGKPVDELKVSDLGLEASQAGWAGAGQEITDIAAAEERQAGEIVVDEGDGHERIVQFLEKLKLV
jgi:electron transfer flavoprotein beta subunit